MFQNSGTPKFLTVAWLLMGSAAFADDRPNIIVMLVDDMGFSDLGCYGEEISTPNIDRLAKNGVRFNQFYNTARCCPTRACLLTGLYQHQAGVGHMVGNQGHPAYQGYLNNKCVTIGEVLRAADYKTLCIGKWHVGSARGHWPLDRGFDRFFGCPVGGGFYFRNSMAKKNRFLTLGNDEVEFRPGEYVTDLFTDYALQFVDEAARGDAPFFLYFAHIAPHWPLQAKEADIEKYSGRYDEGWDRVRDQRYQRQVELGIVDPAWGKSDRDSKAVAWDSMSDKKKSDLSHRMSVYAAQIDSIDQNVGRLFELLQKHEAVDNTVFMLVSDNGCSAEGGPGGFRQGDKTKRIGTDETYASAGLEWANVSDIPFRKFKTQTHEGGISTPFIVHWPDGAKSDPNRGRIESQVGHVIDIMPTCAELAQATYPATYND
ncbi:MAG: arylsulfatase, partial [Planctomycetales bacterium]|nr:arylsulfatase [Planctomycetales bacterium]